MSGETLVSAVERFFLDIVGLMVPGGGAILAVYLLAHFGDDVSSKALLAANPSSTQWVLGIVGAFMVGHVVTSIGETLAVPFCDLCLGFVRRAPLIGRVLPEHVVPKAVVDSRVKDSATYKAFCAIVEKASRAGGTALGGQLSLSEARNVALTWSGEDKYTIYRFRFLALLHLGVACVLAGAWSALVVLQMVRRCHGAPALGAPPWWWALILLGVVLPLLERRYYFAGMALRVPFAMALARSLDRSKGADGSPRAA